MSNIESFRLKRIEGGTRLRDATLAAPLRYGPIPLPEGTFSRTGISFFPVGYDTMHIWVQIPAGIPWDQAVLVRGGFAPPTTPLDGVVTKLFLPTDKNIASIEGGAKDTLSWIVEDTPLTGGNWYYYSLIIRNGLIEDDTQWTVAAYGMMLLPKDFGMTELLFQSLPEFYRLVDQNNAYDGEFGHLYRFLNVVGYGLDTTYSYIDCGPLSVYDIDRSPFINLLLETIGLGGEPFLGARKSTYALHAAQLLALRGSVLGLEGMVESASGYTCTVTMGNNLLLTSDDAEFINGTGFWYPVTDPVADAINAKDADFGNGAAWGTATRTKHMGVITPPDGLGVMEVQATGAGGIIYGLNNSMASTTRLVPVNPATNYFFRFQGRGGGTGHDFDMGIVWFDKAGVPISVEDATNVATGGDMSTTVWKEYSKKFLSPVDAVAAAPFIQFKSTGLRYISGIDLQQVGTAGAGDTPVPPDYTLLLGSASHLLAGTKSVLESP